MNILPHRGFTTLGRPSTPKLGVKGTDTLPEGSGGFPTNTTKVWAYVQLVVRTWGGVRPRVTHDFDFGRRRGAQQRTPHLTSLRRRRVVGKTRVLS